MCSDELAWLLLQFGENLEGLWKTRDSSFLGNLDAIVEEASYLMGAESEDCLHTDETLNELQTFVSKSLEAAKVLYKNNAWNKIQELQLTVQAMADELRSRLEDVAEMVTQKGVIT